MSHKHPNSLGRHEKLKSRKQIDILFTNRRFFTQPPIRMFYHIEEKSTTNPVAISEIRLDLSNTSGISANLHLRAGFSASKRYFKHASKRNRVKRLMREVYRTHKQPLSALAQLHGYHISLFFLYSHKELPTYEQIEEKLCPLLKKLEAHLQSS